MKRWRKWTAIAAVVIVVGGGGVWIALDASARRVAHNFYHEGLALLGLGSGTPQGESFWCPMHPQIRRQAPGTCPI